MITLEQEPAVVYIQPSRMIDEQYERSNSCWEAVLQQGAKMPTRQREKSGGD